MEVQKVRSVDVLKGELARRFREPCGSVTFYSHLFLAVLLGGGAGIWLTLIKSGLADLEKCSAALLTYFPALVAAAVIEFTHESEKYLRSFGLIAAGVFIIVFGAAATEPGAFRFCWSCLGAILGIAFWWVANGAKDWRDVNAAAAYGGNENRALPKAEDDAQWQK